MLMTIQNQDYQCFDTPAVVIISICLLYPALSLNVGTDKLVCNKRKSVLLESVLTVLLYI